MLLSSEDSIYLISTSVIKVGTKINNRLRVHMILKVRSYYTAIVLRCRTAPSCTEIVM